MGIGLPLVLLLLAGCQSTGKEESSQRETKWEEAGQSPYFTDAEDLYVVRGNSIDFKSKIRAFDSQGKELTEQIRVDASKVVLDQCGAYEIFYTVEDEQGNLAQIGCSVYVVEGDAAVPVILEENEPAFVRICSKEVETVLWGSGFILELGEENIYVMTNAHVVGEGEITVYFHQGKKARGVVLGKKEVPDMALLQIDKRELEEADREGLKAVEIDLAHWDSLDSDNLPAVGYRCLNPDGTLWIEKTGKLLTKQEEMWAVDYPVVRYTMENERGASGSAIIDQSGKLIAMVLGVSKEEDSTAFWGIGLPDLLVYYEEVRNTVLEN